MKRGWLAVVERSPAAVTAGVVSAEVGVESAVVIAGVVAAKVGVESAVEVGAVESAVKVSVERRRRRKIDGGGCGSKHGLLVDIWVLGCVVLEMVAGSPARRWWKAELLTMLENRWWW
ncbi:PREDICTED: uncharacterized protein LOC105974641 isoform X2 [Erythranthe guttata]|uniref:uncharacterized protein LOC105974641 isoform X1 n=1 Tax=Erythranthe guttata TaxID=4155 RepID=UPI00064D9D0C|nr:PREDICTED: uncharacterized protein LOC105974641 isoform X1 [Erythranthe guttata]XP_012855212.1 PREDICTED: uncharacterized protein LOC105974641 isoform X2 [Erythranthe guttata]|eukprot:XP_012855211.1 PREDICTED: uncharacterized protein LOC105974641 isoform X1 [Erythranthe guttata]